MEAQAQEPAEEISSPARILQLLSRAQEQHTELRVHAGDEQRSWRTTIQRINPEEGRVVYGQLLPPVRHGDIDFARPLKIFSPAKENCFTYIETLQPLDDDGAVQYLESGMPQQMEYHQLRGHYRVLLAGRRARVAITTAADKVYEGDIINISVGGCRALLKTEELDLGDPRENLLAQLHVENLLELECCVRLCHIRIDGEGATISLELMNLEPSQLNRLQRCLVEIERSTMRHIGQAPRGWRKRAR